ncbi:MAG: signal peptidase I [Endomicrobium sp.]|jgi:signal peptidase I|nr:signal peptidase I [Endomicrobium sp.]
MEYKLFIVGFIMLAINIILILIKHYFQISLSHKLLKFIYSWIDSAWAAFILASFIMFFCIKSFKIPSGSMKNTLIEGDHIFVNKFIYGIRRPFVQIGPRYFKWHNIHRGDIVVFQCPPQAMTLFEQATGVKKDFIKRCIGIEGDTIEIKDRQLFVNKQLIHEPYVIFSNKIIPYKNNVNVLYIYNKDTYQKEWERGNLCFNPLTDDFGPVTIPKGHYMMLGDNRDVSFDSRFWGPLPDKYIKGKAFCIYWPITRWKIL